MESILRREECIVFGLRALYSKYGYRPYRMSKFEEYDLYADNRSFLPSGGVITFTDTNGRLMALKPDVTLSIAKNLGGGPEAAPEKLYYDESVYRAPDSGLGFQEITQVLLCLCSYVYAPFYSVWMYIGSMDKIQYIYSKWMQFDMAYFKRTVAIFCQADCQL